MRSCVGCPCWESRSCRAGGKHSAGEQLTVSATPAVPPPKVHVPRHPTRQSHAACLCSPRLPHPYTFPAAHAWMCCHARAPPHTKMQQARLMATPAAVQQPKPCNTKQQLALTPCPALGVGAAALARCKTCAASPRTRAPSETSARIRAAQPPPGVAGWAACRSP